MDTLSLELIERITSHCSSNQDRARLGRVNKQFYHGTRRKIFHTVTITNPNQYKRFIQFIETFEKQGYLKYTKKIDLSSYNIRGSGWTSDQAKGLVQASMLAHWIKKSGYLEQLMIGDELMHVFVEPELIQSIFNYDPHPYLKVIDFTGFCDQGINEKLANAMFSSSSPSFIMNDREGEDEKKDDNQVISTTNENLDIHLQPWMKIPPKLSQLSFHMCMALSPTLFFLPFFERLSLNGNCITRLDLAYTQITNQVFDYLDPLQLTHLNLQGCKYISCCSSSSSRLIDFLLKATNLIELNLNMHFNGTPSGQQFCESCLSSLLSNCKQHCPSLKILDLGGQANLKDHHLLNNITLLQQLSYFSIAYAPHITYQPFISTLLPKFKSLEYLNISKSKHIQPMIYPLLNQLDQPSLSSYLPCLKVIELDNPKNYLHSKIQSIKQVDYWQLHQYGRRSYYAKNNTDPRFKYSQKLLMMDDQPQSPMMKYWSFSY
ncbi:unnamed protein product [Cunninghamella blakesleeana]